MDVLEKMEIEANFELDQMATKTEIGSDEHKKATADFAQIADRIVELRKVENERKKIELEEAKMEADKSKVDLERQKQNDERKHNLIRYVLDGAGIVVPAAITVLGLFLTYRIEVDGVQASQLGRKTIDRIFRMK